MDRFEILRPAPGNTFSGALASLFDKMDRFFGDERAEGRHPVFVRFFLSDAQNQIAALAQTASEKKTGLFHSLRLTEEEAAGKDS